MNHCLITSEDENTHRKALIISKEATQPAATCLTSVLPRSLLTSSIREGQDSGKSLATTFLRVLANCTVMLLEGEWANNGSKLAFKASRSERGIGAWSGRGVDEEERSKYEV